MDENERKKIPRPAPAGSDARGQTLPYTPETNPASALNTSAPSAHAQARQMEADDPFIIRDSHGNVDEGATIGSLAAQAPREDGGEAPAAAPGPAGERRGYDTLPKPLSAEERRLGELERIVQDLKKNQWFPRPQQPVFIARVTQAGNPGTAGNPTSFAVQWQEQCYFGGTFTDYTDGRKSTSYTDGTAAFPLPMWAEPVSIGDFIEVSEFPDPSTGAFAYRYKALPKIALIVGLAPLAGTGVYIGGIRGDGNDGRGSEPYVNITTLDGAKNDGIPVTAGGSPLYLSNGVTGGPAIVINLWEPPFINGDTANNTHMLVGDIALHPNHGRFGRIIGYTADVVPFPVLARVPIVLITEVPLPVIPVFVERDGGADGTSTTAATWTYTVINMGGETIMTGATPLKRRPLGSCGSEGGVGLAVATNSVATGGTGLGPATYALLDAFEVPNYTAVMVVTSVNSSTTVLTPNSGPAGPNPFNGITVFIDTAPLTPGGTQGSMSFIQGILTAEVQAT